MFDITRAVAVGHDLELDAGSLDGVTERSHSTTGITGSPCRLCASAW